jgi:hypothetical protein
MVTVFGAASRDDARHLAAGVTGLSRAHDVLVSGMAHSFGVAAIFDVCALAVVLAGLTRRRSPRGGERAQ